MEEQPHDRGWPGDLGSDHSAAGTLRRWEAVADGLRTNPRGRRRAARMLAVLLAVVAAAATVVYLLT